MEWFRLQGRRLLAGRRVCKAWRASKKKPGRTMDRRSSWEIPLIHPETPVPQPQLADRAERLRGAVDDAARLAQNLYLSFLLLGTYIAVIIGSTTDGQLLKTSPVTLPLLNVQLPIVGFYVFIPWLLLLLYVNLLLHLTFLAQKLYRFHAVLAALTDVVAREDQYARMFPFPFSALLIAAPAPWHLRGLLGLMVGTTVVLLPLGLLLWAQVRFLPYHDTAITWNHRIAVLVDLAVLWLFWSLLFPPAPCQEAPAHGGPLGRAAPRAVRRAAGTRRRRWRIGLSGLTGVTVVFALGIAVLPDEGMERWLVANVLPQGWVTRQADPDQRGHGVFTLTFGLFEAPGAPLHRNLRLQEQVLVAGEPSAKVLAALQQTDESKRAQGLDELTGLILTNRDLRGANFRETLFPKADLRGANLQRAMLRGARVFAGTFSAFPISEGGRCVEKAQQSEENCVTNLQGADLRGAQLQGADLRGAPLQGAFLQFAQLQGADLRGAPLQGAGWAGAQLQRANLAGAPLQGANLRGAPLQGADLRGAPLQGAFLWGAPLQGADLRGAPLQGAFLLDAQLQGAFLQFAQLQGAFLLDAQLQGADLRGAQLQGAFLLDAPLQGADLRGAPLQGAFLLDAPLQGADLRGAQLQGAFLLDAQLQGANLAGAQLQGATLAGANIGSADFSTADLTWSDLRNLAQSPLDKKTFGKLEKILTDVLSDPSRRADRLAQMQEAVGRSTNLSAARSQERSVLCDTVELFRFCVTQADSAEYTRARAVFLETLGCESQDAAVARGIAKWHYFLLAREPQKDPIPMTCAKHVTARPEKDCLGWAAVPADVQDAHRCLAAEQTSAP